MDIAASTLALSFGAGLASVASPCVLPVLPAGAATRDVPPFKTTPAGLSDLGVYEDEPPVWQVVEDVLDGSVTVTTSEYGAVTPPDGLTSLYSGERLEMTARDDDPASARMANAVVYRLRDGDAEILVEASGTVTSTVSDFEMEGTTHPEPQPASRWGSSSAAGRSTRCSRRSRSS